MSSPRLLIVGIVLAAALAFPCFAAAATAPIAIGTSEDDLAGIAVDSAGTAYIAWEDSSGPFLHFCKLPAGASACSVTSSLTAPQPSGGSGLLGTPSVIVDGSDVLVFAYDNGEGDDSGEVGWISTDGGITFTQQPAGFPMSYAPPNNDSTTTNPVGLLGNGLVGVGYVVPLGSPEFQAVQYDPFTGTYQMNFNGTGTYGPYATLDPNNTYAAGNLGGEFGSVPIGSANAGVMGAIAAFPGAAQDPCQGDPPFIAWTYAPLNASTTQAALNTSPGTAGSAWTNGLTPLDCNTEDPAVAGGPAGFGILDGSFSGGGTYYHRFDSATDSFDPQITISNDDETSPSLSQDSAGGVYATWGTGLTELRLAYSPDGGTDWYGPVTMDDSTSTGNGLGDPASAVNGSGAGWAVYHVGGTEYAIPFSKVTSVIVPTPGSKGTSNGKVVSVQVSCQVLPCTIRVTITATVSLKHGPLALAAKKGKHKPTSKTITLAKGTFTITKKGTHKLAVRLSGPGKGLLSKDGGHLTGTIVLGEKVAGSFVTGPTHKLKISTKKGKGK
jgi:hypothetical protein